VVDSPAEIEDRCVLTESTNSDLTKFKFCPQFEIGDRYNQKDTLSTMPDITPTRLLPETDAALLAGGAVPSELDMSNGHVMPWVETGSRTAPDTTKIFMGTPPNVISMLPPSNLGESMVYY